MPTGGTEDYRCDCHRCARRGQDRGEWLMTIIALVVGVAAAFVWLALT